MKNSQNQSKNRTAGITSEKSVGADRQALEEVVAGVIARELAVSTAAVDRRVPFRELGVDSVMAQTIRNSLEQALGCPISIVALFDYDTVEQMSAYLSALAGPDRDDSFNRPAPDEKVANQVVFLELQLDDCSEDELWELLKNELGD